VVEETLNPGSSPASRRRCFQPTMILVLLILVTLLAQLQLRLQPYLEDDAYIHLRIARNLATHGVPYFNLDEPVSASSAPLWTVLLALGLGLGLSGGAAVMLVSTLSLTVATGCAPWVVAGENRHPWLSIWGLAGAVMTLCVVLPTACMGMETPLLAALLILGLVLSRRRRHVALFFLALSCAVRVEMIVPFVAVLCWALLSWRSRWKTVLMAAGGILPLVVYDLVFFGTLIPHAAIAKSQLYSLSLARVASDLAVALVPFPAAMRVHRGLIHGGFLVVLLGLVSFVIFRRTRESRSPLSLDPVYVIALGSGLVITVAYLWRHVFIHSWYPPVILLPAGLGLLGLLRWEGSKTAMWLAVLVIGLLLFPASQTIAGATHPEALPWFSLGARARAYYYLGCDLERRFPGTTMVAAEIGGLGWGFTGPVRDGTGIASPAALRWHPMSVPSERSRGDIGAIPPGYVEQLHPELIVSHPHFLEAVLVSPIRKEYVRLNTPLFLADDARKMKRPQLWGASEIVVLVRRDVLARRERP